MEIGIFNFFFQVGLKNESLNMPRIFPCLSGESNYQMIGQRCIYFDKSTSNYDVARERCKSTFNSKGRMYEPRNFEESTKIAKEGKSKYNYGIWWLGVNDINEEGKLVFDSDGAPVPFTPTWYDGNDDYHDCVLVYHSTSDPKWQIISCSNRVSMGTLCEYGE